MTPRGRGKVGAGAPWPGGCRSKAAPAGRRPRGSKAPGSEGEAGGVGAGGAGGSAHRPALP